MISASRKPRAFAPDPNAPGIACDAPGCAHPGEFRAPKSRTDLRAFYWFCLEHVRAYNASWDFYRGMSPGEIEAELRADSAWQRPSWPLGQAGRGFRAEEAAEAELHDFTFGRQSGRPPTPSTPTELREPLDVLGLLWPVTLDAVKAKYKELAKRHHPDANNGDKRSEERLKRINLAYATLRGKLAQVASTSQAAD